MADKKNAGSAVRVKAQQLREEQERKDRRTRAIIIGVVLAVVLVVVVVVGTVIYNQVRAKEEAMSVDPVTAFGEYANGQPIIYSHLGVGKVDPALPTLTEYFDYSCPACAGLEVFIGDQVSALGEQGKANIAFQPVNTHRAPIHFAATSAALTVAQKDPEHLLAFHHALLAWVNDQVKAGNNSIMGDVDKSEKQVKQIATEVGVPADVVDSFPVGVVAMTYLEASTNDWVRTTISGREKLGTPELVANNSTSVRLVGDSPQEILATIESALASTPRGGAADTQSGN